MINSHLHILHLAATTLDDKVNRIASIRLKYLLRELKGQGITDYTIIEGFYDPKNTKQAIHKGHRLIVQLAKEQGMNECVIAEDDIKFSHPNSYKYFISQVPKSYDIFSGLMYAGTLDENNRITNGASGIMSLFVVHSRHYEFFLSMDVNNHIDREAGLTAYKHEYYVCEPMVCEQRGGWSFNRKASLFYTDYLRDKKLFGVDL